MDNNTINRINLMENNLDTATRAVSDFEKALENFLNVQSNIKELSDYYFSKLWLEDFDADSRGELPCELKRGVLSEDAAYNLICLNNELLSKLR